MVFFFLRSSICLKRKHIQYIILCKVQNLYSLCAWNLYFFWFHIIAAGILITLLSQLCSCTMATAGQGLYLVRFDVFQRSQQHCDGEECCIPIAILKLCLTLFSCLLLLCDCCVYSITPCTRSNRRVSLSYNHVWCIWMTPSVSTLEYLAAFELLSGSRACVPPSISNVVWVMIFSPCLSALLTGHSSATITVSRCPD